MKFLNLKASLFLSFFTLLFTAHLSAQQWDTVGIRHFSTGGIVPYGFQIAHNANDELFMAYCDTSLSPGQGVVRKFNGSSWQPVGIEGFTPNHARNASIAFGSGDTIYFAYSDSVVNYRNSVMMFDGSNWTNITTGISDTEAWSNTIIKGNDDTLYLVYAEKNNTNVSPHNHVKAKVYDGSTWQTMGTTTILNNRFHPTAKLDNNGVLYISMTEATNVELVRFNGTDFVSAASSFNIGPNTFTTSLAFNSANVPFVAAFYTFAAGVKKYVNNNWVDLGSIADFPYCVISPTSLAIGQNDTPFIAFRTGVNYIACKKFNGTAWASVGSGTFSVAHGFGPSLSIDDYNNPFVGYADDNTVLKTTVMSFKACTPPLLSTVLLTGPICQGDTALMAVGGTLGGATNWYWYTGSCGGTLVDSGTSISVSPGDSTQYFVTAMGGCVNNPVNCVGLFLEVLDSVATPVITVNGSLLISSIANGNQWFTNGAPILGQTNATFTAITSGWYYTVVTNGNCSNFSDSVYVIGTGINNRTIAQQLEIFPVPFSKDLNINIHSNPADWKLSISDNIGRIVHTQTELAEINSIDLTHLSPGMYFLTVANAEGRQVYKLIKQ